MLLLYTSYHCVVSVMYSDKHKNRFSIGDVVDRMEGS